MTICDTTAANIARAGAAIADGRLVAFPTETVYGLGGDATAPRAVAKIFAAKGRPRFNPLIVHVCDPAAADQFACVSGLARTLADALWPGPMTLVMMLRPGAGIAELATAGLDTVAVRVPSHPVARALIGAAGTPIAAPSANLSGHVSATQASHVADDFGNAVDIVLDGGPCRHGLESTIVDVTGSAPIILRQGAIAAAAIAHAADCPAQFATTSSPAPRAPGQLTSHYAPKCRVRLNARDVEPDEALLAFGSDLPEHAGACENLSPGGDVVEAAINLFAALRRLDRPGIKRIAVMPIPEHGLGLAINDRLRRAAAPRPHGP